MLARGAPHGKDIHMRTWLSERFGLDVPVVCAPMAGAAGGELAAAVSRGGGLGMIGAGAVTPEWIGEQCKIAGSAGRPFGVGLLAWLLADNPGQLDAVLAARPALVSVSYGPYQRYLPALHEAGVTVATQAGTVAEAQAAEQAGVDVIVARGGEGGGHGRNDVATLPLLQMVLDTVAVPVLAAGGAWPRCWRRVRPAPGWARRFSPAPRQPPRRAPGSGCWRPPTPAPPTGGCSTSRSGRRGHRSTAAARCATGSSTAGPATSRTSRPTRRPRRRWRRPSAAAITTSPASTPARAPPRSPASARPLRSWPISLPPTACSGGPRSKRSSGQSRAPASAPRSGGQEVAGGANEQGKFGSFRLGGDGVAGHRGGKAALRTERKPLGIAQRSGLAE